jgi:predicted O-methyltransferase YrrM
MNETESKIQKIKHLLSEFLSDGVDVTFNGKGDSDQHLLTLFSIALSSCGKTFIELGVREGKTTLPLLLAAYLNGGKLISVDKESSSFQCPDELRSHWEFIQNDALEFLKGWNKTKMDFVYIDDWHAYSHVKRELELIDPHVGPSSVILIHDLMYGNTAPFYHSDMPLKDGQWSEGGPYRAVAELDMNFWEWATLPWNNGLTLVRKKYSSKYHTQ